MTRITLLLIAALLLCALALACGGDDDSTSVSPQIAAREHYADQMVDRGFLRPPVPHYMPSGVSAIGGVLEGDATAEHIVISYPPLVPPGTTTDPGAPYLTLVANLEPDGVQSCTPGVGPAPYAIQCLDVNGEPSMLQVTPTTSTAVAFLATRLGDLSVFVSVDWPAASATDVAAAEQAKTEVVLVAQGLAVE